MSDRAWAWQVRPISAFVRQIYLRIAETAPASLRKAHAA